MLATFWLKKHDIQQGDKNVFDSKAFETYGGLTPSTSQISIPSLVVLRCPAAAQRCCKVLKIQQRGYPREIFSIRSKFKFLPKQPDMLANFMLVSYLKTILRCRHPFSHNILINGGHFWAKKKHNTQQGDKNFFVSKSFETYGGLTPSTTRISKIGRAHV